MQPKIKVVIIEDEPDNQDLMRDFIKSRDELELLHISGTMEDAIHKINELTPDLIFLDISLPDGSGLSVLENIKAKPYIIFTTAYSEHAVHAFEVGAIDYVVKPIMPDRFNMAVDRALEHIRMGSIPGDSDNGGALSVMEKEKLHIIPFEDIIYLSSHNKYTVIHSVDADISTIKYLKEIEQKLPESLFFRIHRQYIINIKYISQFHHENSGRYSVILSDSDDTTLSVSRTYADSLKKLLTRET